MDPSPTHPRPIGLELINLCFIFTRPKPLSYMRAVSLFENVTLQLLDVRNLQMGAQSAETIDLVSKDYAARYNAISRLHLSSKCTQAPTYRLYRFQYRLDSLYKYESAVCTTTCFISHYAPICLTNIMN